MPEHVLLRNIGELPQLSTGLRNRVLIDVHRQIHRGRWADRFRVAGAFLAASLVVWVVWTFRMKTQDQVVERMADPPSSSVAPPQTLDKYSSSSSSATTVTPVPPESLELSKPQGGPSNRNLREIQQLNQLIEQIQGRNNTLCGMLPSW